MSVTAATDDSAKLEKRVVSIGQALNGHNNSLGLLRLILASLVIFDHAFPLGGFGRDPLWTHTQGQASLGSIAVAGFFVISGYLIAKSGMSSDVVQFMWRRTLRIFPAYWVVLLLTAFIIAPILWLSSGETLATFFSGQGTGVGVSPYFYFTGNWTLNIGTYGIYDLLTNTTPYGREVHASALNGSIWTLMYEWQCYLLIAALVLFGVMKKARIVVPAMTLVFLFLQYQATINWQSVPLIVPSFLADPYTISLGFTFFVGAAIAVYSKQVPFDDWLGAFSGVVLLVTLRTGGFSTIGTIAGGYFILYLAARLPKKLQWIGQKNDYSYGIYIYGFMVQQVLAYLGVYRLGYFPFVVIALIFTSGFAWLSWHAIEKRAMFLKDWGPGKGLLFWSSEWKLRARAKKFFTKKSQVN